MNIVRRKFKGEFKGCVLNDLWYDEEINNSSSDEWARQYNSHEAVVLLSNFQMEEELGVKYKFNTRQGYYLDENSVGIVKYADNFVILCKTKEEEDSMYWKLNHYLNKRGLKLAENKTKITHISKGFDFLGFNII